LSLPPASALRRVPGLERGAVPRLLARLGGGSVNQVFRVDSDRGRFVLRLNGADWRRPGVERERELRLHRAASRAGIAPAIAYAEPAAQGLLITEFQDGRAWCEADYDDVAALQRLGERLQALHRLPAPEVAQFDPWAVAQQYLRRIEAAPPAWLHPEQLDAALRRLEGACAKSGQSGAASSIVHGDLAHHNLLDGQRLWLLDWEYAQRSDPLMDLACVLAYYPVAQRHLTELAAAAGVGVLDAEGLAARVYIYRALSWLWHLARGEPASAP
jgi:thiamine kinase